jgi:hypothetical protein
MSLSGDQAGLVKFGSDSQRQVRQVAKIFPKRLSEDQTPLPGFLKEKF